MNLEGSAPIEVHLMGPRGFTHHLGNKNGRSWREINFEVLTLQKIYS